MATVANIIDLIWKNLDGGDYTDDSRFTRREIAIYARAGLAQAMQENVFQLLSLGEDAFKYYSGLGKVTTQPVKVDDSGLQYIDLPAKSLAFGGMRNYDVSPANPFSRWALIYVGIRPEEVLVSKLQANVPNVIQYTVKDNKLVFFNGIVNEKELTLTQKLSIPNDDDYDFEVPDEVIGRAVAIAIPLAERELKIQDRTIDGVSTT